MSVIRIPSPRSVIDRRALVEAIEAVVAETGHAKGLSLIHI